jgi:purine-binding chemotaxis protein CheW
LSDTTSFVVFRLDERRYALPLTAVERVIRAVEVTPLPTAPAIVLGVINMQGRVLPVLNVRKRFVVPDREIGPADWFLIARTARQTVVLVIDQADGVIDQAQIDIVRSAQIVPSLEQFPGVVRLDDGLVLIHDLDRFLSLDETKALDTSMSQRTWA